MQQIKLSIPEPCHEGWDNMTPSEKGRFCSSCQKEVIDFTGMTDDELFAFFAQKTQGSVCGRTHVGQLETPIAKPIVHKKKKFWYLQYAASLLLLFAKPSGAKAQIKPAVTVTPPHPIRMGTVAYVQPVEKTSLLIKGTVVDEAGEPIVSASVTVKGYSHGVATDKEGHYQLRVKQKDIIIFSAIGYESQQIVANDKDLSLTTVLKTSRQMLEGQIVVVGGLSCNSDDAKDYEVPRYRALLQVKDKTNNGPLPNASLTIVENNRGKQNQVQTNREGAYLMRRVKANETYTVIVTAKGYQTKNIRIDGNELKSGNNLKTILLEKEPMVQTLEEVAVTGIMPNIKKSNLDILLLGRMGCGIVNNDAKQTTLNLRANPIAAIPAQQEHTVFIYGDIVSDAAITQEVKVNSPKTKTSFLKKIFSKSGASSNTPTPINIFPNPAKINSPIVIAFKTVPKGSYRLQLLNAMGSLVQQQQITVPAAAFHFQWDLGSQVVAGHYIINVMDAKGKIIHNGKMTVL